MQISSLLFICFVGFCSAAVYRERQKSLASRSLAPGKLPFCVDKIEGKKKVGEVWQDRTQCVQKLCLTDSKGAPLIQHISCGTTLVSPPCKLVTPSGTKPYPACCPIPVC